MSAERTGWPTIKAALAAVPAGMTMALGVGAVLHLVHTGHHEERAPGPVLHWLRDSALALPLAVVAVAVATALLQRVFAWIDDGRPRPASRVLQVTLAAMMFAAFSVPANAAHARLFGAESEGSFAVHALRDASIVFVSSSGALAMFALVVAAMRPHALGIRRVWATSAPGLVVTAVVVAIAGGIVVGQQNVAQGLGSSVCPAGARQISYDIAAFETVIPLNGWGDKIPNGLVYGLSGSDARIGKAQMLANPNLTQPIVIRANVGDCVNVTFRNDIAGRRVGLHADGVVRADPKDADGARVGRNPDSTVAPNAETSFSWYADHVGEGAITDIANLQTTELEPSTIQRGLYGAIVVHPAGATWHNPTTGDNLLDPATGRALETQIFADIRRPDAPDFRSYAIVFMDENEGILDRDGKQPTFPTTGLKDSTFGINYRSEPLRNRLRAVLEHRGTKTPENPSGVAKTVRLPNGRIIAPDDHFCDGYAPELGVVVADPGAKCLGEESHLQAWPFGDQGKLVTLQGDTPVTDTDNMIPKAYVGDPVTFHVVHPGAKETHPWHQHTQRWFADPDNPNSPRNDVQSIGPGEARRLTLEVGAGGLQHTIGDSIFHCHLYPHFAQGFWGDLRIFDRLRDGSQRYPDGTQLQPLVELPDRAGVTPAATADHPGFPLFVKGDVGQRAYRPPNAVVKDDFASWRRPGDAPRGPTDLEQANLPGLGTTKLTADGETVRNTGSTPGAGFINPCPTAAPVRTYRPHAIDTKITYNDDGWTDPEGRIYVEETHVDAVRNGTERPQPYTIRSRIGECVQVLTSNDLHLDDDPTMPIDVMNDKDGVYQTQIETSEISTHVHLVEFDELGSDGTSVGWNYTQSAMPGQTYGYRWFVDTALRTVFFHDHQYANSGQQKGLYSAMNVEPADATWHDPQTGAQTDGTGTVADIHTPSGPDFREFSVFYQDRSPMWRDGGAGPAIDPPPVVDDFGADQGGMAINYRNQPFALRTNPAATGPKADPAYVYSSAVHGDPSTPVFQAYSGDPVIIRHMTGAHEEVHTFNLHGHRWLSQPDNPLSNTIDTQTTSLGEFFNYEINGGGSVVKRTLSLVDMLRRATNTDQNGTPRLVQSGAGRPGDYLYGSTSLDDQWLGMWGIFRVPGARVPELQPLPDRAAPASGQRWPALRPGDPVTKATTAGANVCPSLAPVRTFRVNAIQTDIVYNQRVGDHDPNGVLYVLDADEAAVRSGAKKTEPLVIRARAGDCVKLTLTNKLPAGGIPAHDGDVPVPFNQPFPTSNRVSMHPALVRYDPTRSDGATVGYNYDQTVAPGESITYIWYADPGLIGTGTNLVDFGDRRGHRHHGLWGGLMIEPPFATWTDPTTGASLPSGTQADVKIPGTPIRFREFVIDLQDGLNLRDPAGNPIADAGGVDDPEDAGDRGINYRTERFAPRLESDPEVADVMSSQVHGDPATPVFRAYTGDQTVVRVLQGSDRARAHTMVLNGHRWSSQLFDPSSRQISTVGGIEPATAFTLRLTGGAGGVQKAPGDYLFRDGLLINQVNAGLWGLLRVSSVLDPTLKPLQ